MAEESPSVESISDIKSEPTLDPRWDRLFHSAEAWRLHVAHGGEERGGEKRVCCVFNSRHSMFHFHSWWWGGGGGIGAMARLS